jgi:hypothetical protein
MYDTAQLQKHKSVRYDVVYSDSNTDLKLRCETCVNFSYEGAPKTFLVDWWLCVECYYTTTPTDYPNTKRGMSRGHTVAVNIDFSGYLRFLSISFVWIIWVQYATDNLHGQEKVFVS